MTGLRPLALGAILAASAAVASCGNTPPAPGSVPPGQPALTSFTLSGNTLLTNIGETSKITATGHFADGSARDVSAETLWSAEIPGVVTVSKDGSVSAIGLGVTTLFASRQPAFQSLELTVTPPGTTAVGGWAREPGFGSLGGVRVSETGSGFSTVTGLSGDALGTFALGGLTSGHLTLIKESFEDSRFDVTAPGIISVPLQRIIRLTAGDSVSSQIAPHDMDYLVAADTHCGPCKLIRVNGAGATLHFRLVWTDKASLFNVWINGQMFPGDAATLAVEADALAGSGELLVYVAKVPTAVSDNHVPFTFSTTK